MRLPRPTALIAAFLIISFSSPPSLFSQTAPKPSRPKQPAPRQSHPKRPQRAGALAAAINELLKLDPLLPKSPDSDSPDTSERKEKPPGDDAPIRELIKYWLENRYAAMSGAQKPSERVRQRLLEAVDDRPWLAHSLLELLPETPDTSDRLYRLINQEPDDEDGWKWKVHEWLSHNSGYFRDDLLAEIRSTDLGETQTAAALKSLSRLDWEAARPFIESYATGNGDILAPTALSLLYEHEMKFGDAAKAEGYRAGLKAMVANRQAPEITRGAAGATLFADPSLSGLREAKGNEPDGKEETKDAKAKLETTIIIAPPEFHRPPPANLLSTVAPKTGELIPVVSSLISHSSRTVHNAAVRWLANMMGRGVDLKLRREVARKLLPWLTDPGWVDEGDRASFIGGFADLELPESVAGLIWILDFDESADNRAAAAAALAQFPDPSANPALRRALDREEDEERRGDIVTALAECGGFSDDEMAAAIEAYVKVALAEEDELDANYDQSEDEKKPLPLEVSIGRIFSDNLRSQFTERLAVRLIERAKALRATQPKVARSRFRVVEGLSLRVAEIHLVERIGEGWADVDSIKHAIHCVRDSFLRLNKDGGRRIVICSMRRAPKNPTLHEELGGMFHKLTDSGEFKVRFALEDKITGLEVMWADKKQPDLSVCQEKGELRVLTGNPFAYFFKGLNAPAMPEWLNRAFAPALAGRLKGDSEPASPEWRIFTKDGIGAVAPDTPGCRRSASVTFNPAPRAVFQTIVGFTIQITISQDDSEEVYAVPQGKNQGVWKAESGRDKVKLLDDAYQSVLALPDGKWLIGRKVINEGGKVVAQLVRHNLRTNEAFPIVFSREGDHRPISFSEAHGKALIVDGDALSPQANGYLLDIETGATQAVSGDFRPIANGGTRNLQPAGKPNEFWAAIFDHRKQATVVGRYDAKLFAFMPLIQLPELRFDSTGAWIDQTTGRLWMVYRGCLLRLPLPK